MSQRADKSRQYSTAGPTRRASPGSRRPAAAPDGIRPPIAHQRAEFCRLAAFARKLSAVHGSGSSAGQTCSSALAAARAAGSWTWAGAASLIAD